MSKRYCQKCILSKTAEATLLCRDCRKYLCASCDDLIHDKSNKHRRFELCEECEEDTTVWFCSECNQKLCGSCEQLLHKGGTRRNHYRRQVGPLLKVEKQPGVSSFNPLRRSLSSEGRLSKSNSFKEVGLARPVIDLDYDGPVIK